MDKMLETLAAGLPELGLTLDQEILNTLCGFGTLIIAQTCNQLRNTAFKGGNIHNLTDNTC